MVSRLYQHKIQNGIDLKYDSDTGSFFGKEISGREIAFRAKSDSVFRLANAWLNQCAGIRSCSPGHKLCYLMDLPPHFSFSRDENGMWVCNGPLIMPSRTIDVGPLDGSRQPFLAIHTDHTSCKPQPWVALSHCWGTSKPLLTTLETIDSHKKGIPMASLPKTFQDAVFVTRRLGVLHLSIDSLCIIQDWERDWRSEARNMGEIYRHALLTLAPSASIDSHSGFLNKTRMSAALDCRIGVRSKKYGSGTLYLGITQGVWTPSLAGGCSNAARGSQLYDRASVLQETMLSPRTLHFTSYQVYWECCESVYTEDCIAPVSSIRDTSANDIFFSTSTMDTSMKQFLLSPPVWAVFRPEDKRRHRRVLYNRWHQIVGIYSGRRLSFASDIFEALIGIAKIMQSMLGDRYIAGIFDGDLVRGLLWTSPEWHSRARTREFDHGYRAPSWSWASRHGWASWNRFIQDSLLSMDSPSSSLLPIVIEVKLNERFPSPEPTEQHFGAVHSGHLTLRTLWRHAVPEDFLFAPRGMFGEESAMLDDGRYEDFESMKSEFGDINLLYMGVFGRYMYGLLLVPVDEMKQEFVRIGVFVRPAEWFRANVQLWTMKDVKII